MTDKTERDALVALDVAIASATGSRVTLHLTRAKQLREALAAPAEGGQGEVAGYVDVAQIKDVKRTGGSVGIGTYSEHYGRTTPVYFAKLIDSAGGAKGLCATCGGGREGEADFSTRKRTAWADLP